MTAIRLGRLEAAPFFTKAWINRLLPAGHRIVAGKDDLLTQCWLIEGPMMPALVEGHEIDWVRIQFNEQSDPAFGHRLNAKWCLAAEGSWVIGPWPSAKAYFEESLRLNPALAAEHEQMEKDKRLDPLPLEGPGFG